MDPTTLVTFLFKAPLEARTVELLGSWDNFTQPYRMHHDRRRGNGFWSGCFKFHNIVFDGDKLQWARPRNGGLKQGGIYWYYYRLNDDIETFDNAKEASTACPLLPGQMLNVIEVPVEIVDPPARCRSASLEVSGTLASASSTQTLDPNDKFAVLDPPPICKVHGRYVSDLELNGRLEGKAQSFHSRSSSPPGSPDVEAPGSNSAVSRPTGRYYAGTGGYADDRSSTYSRQSWASEAPSSAHSSIVDAYGIESPTVDEDPSIQYSFRRPESHPTMHDTVEARRRSGFESEPSVIAHSGGQLYAADERPEFDFGFEQSSPFRPSAEHKAEAERDNQPISLQSAEYTSDHDIESYDILSPTFSMATLSSNGANTPHRFSVVNSGGETTSNENIGPDTSLESVTARLRSLRCDSKSQLPSPDVTESHEPAWPGYSLPSPESLQSAQRLDKPSSTQTSIVHDVSLPSLTQVDRGTSFADDIFTELGYLGTSIA